MDINMNDDKVPLFTRVNDLLDGFCQLTLDTKNWMDERLKEKEMIEKNITHNSPPLPEVSEISVDGHNGRPKRKALLHASIKIREEFQNINLNKGKKVKISTKILNSTVIKGKEVIPDFPNISNVKSIEEEKEESQINVETVLLANELLAGSNDNSDYICITPKISLEKKTKKSSKNLFNPYICTSVKKRVEAFEVLRDNVVTFPSPGPSELPMRITRTKTKQLQEEQAKKERTKKIISSKVKKHSRSIHNKENRNSIKGKQQTDISSPNNDKKISQAEQNKIDKAIQKKNQRINLLKDDLKKKNNEKMLKAFNIREAQEKEKQNKIRENVEKVIEQERKKKILEQKCVAVQEKKIENVKKKKEIKKNNQDEALKVLDDNIIVHSNTPNKKKLISKNAEDLRIKLLQSEINRAQPAAINNDTFIQTQNPNSSYKLTPLKKKQNNEHTLQENEVELVEDDEDDDEEDEEIDEAAKKFISKYENHKQIPIWAQYQIRNQNMVQQTAIVTNLFGTKDLQNINKIFPKKTIRRRSSANWNTPVTEKLP